MLIAVVTHVDTNSVSADELFHINLSPPTHVGQAFDLIDAATVGDRFDVVHDHCGFAGMAMANRLDTPLVHTLHGPFTPETAAFYARHGIKIERVMSDNGVGYKTDFANAVAELGAKHKRTRPYTPRTNGKAERFIQTLLREWAYVRPYRSSAWRQRALPRYLRHYNGSRLHSSLNFTAPLSRLKELAA